MSGWDEAREEAREERLDRLDAFRDLWPGAAADLWESTGSIVARVHRWVIIAPLSRAELRCVRDDGLALHFAGLCREDLISAARCALEVL
jgi:hypothetical protein